MPDSGSEPSDVNSGGSGLDISIPSRRLISIREWPLRSSQIPVRAWSMNVAAVCRWATLTWYVSMFASTGSFQLTGTSRLRVPIEVEPPGEIAELGEVLRHREHPLGERRGVRIEVDEHERPPRLAADVRQGEARRVEVAEVAGIRIARQACRRGGTPSRGTGT